MTDCIEFVPKSFPTELLQKDWANRKCYCRENEIEIAHKLHDMEVREDDVWLVTLPHSGDKFMQEMIWLILNNYDFYGVKKGTSNLKSQHFELNADFEKILDRAENLQSPRLISTHLPLPMLPAQVWSKKPKVIYVSRDPLDAQVSYYLNNRNKEITKNKNCEEFLSEHLFMNSSMDHVTEFYALRTESWVLYTSFEHMMTHVHKVTVETVDFLERSITDLQMAQMLHYFSTDGNQKNGFISALWRKFKRFFDRQRFQHDETLGISNKELSPDFHATYEKLIEDVLKKYNVTLHDLLLIKKDPDEEINEEEIYDGEIDKEKNSNGQNNEEAAKAKNKEVEEKDIIVHEEEKKKDSNTADIEKTDNTISAEVNPDVEKKDVHDNAKVEEKINSANTDESNGNIVDSQDDKVEKKNIENNELIEKNGSHDNEKILINFDGDDKDNETKSTEGIENKEIVEKQDNEKVEKIDINDNEKIQNDENKDWEDVKLNDGDINDNVEMKDIDDDKVENKESADNVETTYL